MWESPTSPELMTESDTMWESPTFPELMTESDTMAEMSLSHLDPLLGRKCQPLLLFSIEPTFSL